MNTYIIDYFHNGMYKVKRIKAASVEEACKKARLNKSIVDIQIEEELVKDKYLLRDF